MYLALILNSDNDPPHFLWIREHTSMMSYCKVNKQIILDDVEGKCVGYMFHRGEGPI